MAVHDAARRGTHMALAEMLRALQEEEIFFYDSVKTVPAIPSPSVAVVSRRATSSSSTLKAALSARGPEGVTDLHLAARMLQLKSAECLLQFGALETEKDVYSNVAAAGVGAPRVIGGLVKLRDAVAEGGMLRLLEREPRFRAVACLWPAIFAVDGGSKQLLRCSSGGGRMTAVRILKGQGKERLCVVKIFCRWLFRYFLFLCDRMIHLFSDTTAACLVELYYCCRAFHNRWAQPLLPHISDT